MWPSEVEATYTLRGLDVLIQKAGVGPGCRILIPRSGKSQLQLFPEGKWTQGSRRKETEARGGRIGC